LLQDCGEGLSLLLFKDLSSISLSYLSLSLILFIHFCSPPPVLSDLDIHRNYTFLSRLFVYSKLLISKTERENFNETIKELGLKRSIGAYLIYGDLHVSTTLSILFFLCSPAPLASQI
jgi:hypothetical protein